MRFQISRRRAIEALLFLGGFILGRFAQVSRPQVSVLPPTANLHFDPNLEAFLATLLPEGDFPGYRTSDTLSRLSAALDAGAPLKRFTAEVFDRLDAIAQKKHHVVFWELDQASRDAVLAELAEAGAQTSYLLLRSEAIRLHFSSEAVWRSLRLPGPPQPAGYQDYADAPGS